jgi:general L-amino acid transport system substrate-binding protein
MQRRSERAKSCSNFKEFPMLQSFFQNARRCSILTVLGTCLTMTPATAGTLNDVKARGALNCGVNTALAGFALKSDTGEWSGFDVDFCKAVAAAIFTDARKVNYIPLSATARFDALRSGSIDVLFRNSTWTLEREGAGLLFAGVTYHDGQSFMVVRKPGVSSALELDGAKVCVQAGTTSQRNLSDFFQSNSMKYEEIVVRDPSEAIDHMTTARSDVFTADQSALYAERLNLKMLKDVVVLPDVISKEPLGPVTRSDDVAWFNVIKWVNFALINAEELGISQANADAATKSRRPEILRFVGSDGDLGKSLGLEPTWAINAVRAVGNFGEVFERNVGAKSGLAIPRGLNQLWSMGGILFAPPLQ